jgi:hypothetical protein
LRAFKSWRIKILDNPNVLPFHHSAIQLEGEIGAEMAIEAEHEGKMEIELEVEMEPEHETEHEVVPKKGENDADVIFGSENHIDRKIPEIMKRPAPLLKRQSMMNKTTDEGDVKAEKLEETEKAN